MAIKALVFDAYGTLYDVESVSAVADHVFPGYGEIIAAVWRQKQLEYTWLRTLMGRYQDLSVITRDSLAFTLRCLGLKCHPADLQRIIDKYRRLELYDDAKDTLSALKDRTLAIMTNGSAEMINDLVRNTGLDSMLNAVISIDSTETFKPGRAAYELVEAKLRIPPADVLFVSSNPFDACGAKSFGFRVAWIEHVTPAALANELSDKRHIAASTVVKMLRTQMEELGLAPDYRVRALAELPNIVLHADR
jgi:2-haloacid dehalogenase